MTPRVYQCTECGSRTALILGAFSECMVCGTPIDDDAVLCDGEEDVFNISEEVSDFEDDLFDEY